MTDLHDEIDDPRSRKFDYKGKSFTVTASDPHGFWTIKVAGAKLPANLTGQYTSFQEAERAIQSTTFTK